MLLLGYASSVRSELVVVGHKSLNVNSMTKKKVVDIYMGRRSLLLNDEKIIPLDQTESSVLKKDFYEKLVNRSVHEIDAYWARLIFSGRAKPPQVADGDKHVIDKIVKNPLMIGYIDSSHLTKELKVLIHVE
jgi:ABC-type phosphate transport system substrate-binding protein